MFVRYRSRDIRKRFGATKFGRAVLAHAMNRSMATEGRETFGKGAAKPATCACDECDLAFQHASGHDFILSVSESYLQSSVSVRPTASVWARHMGATIVRSAASGISGISKTTLAPSTIG